MESDYIEIFKKRNLTDTVRYSKLYMNRFDRRSWHKDEKRAHKAMEYFLISNYDV